MKPQIKKTAPIEILVHNAFVESERKKARQEILSGICERNGHVMGWSAVYGCWKCRVCNKLSDNDTGSDYTYLDDRNESF